MSLLSSLNEVRAKEVEHDGRNPDALIPRIKIFFAGLGLFFSILRAGMQEDPPDTTSMYPEVDLSDQGNS